MIRVGFDRPRLYFVPAHNDMSHFMPSHYTTNDFFYMELMEYVQKLQFDTFNMKPDLPQQEIALILKTIREGNEIAPFQSSWAYEMARLIKQAGGHQVWEFNGINSELNGYVRQIVCLGDKRMKRWSWFDAHLLLPAFQFAANVLNRLRKYKTDKEWANWEAFLAKVHKKTS